MKRTIPKSLVQRQEKIRQKTLEVVTQAILALESQGYNIKIKDLVSVAKPHVRKVLVEYGIIQPQITEGADKANNASPRMAMLLAEKDGYIQRLLNENNQLRYEVELLRGKVHLLMHKAAAQGEDDF